MKYALLTSFSRGIGGGLALAATPYIVSALVLGWHGMRRAGGGVKTAMADAGDAARYYGELRGHRKQTGRAPRTAAEMDI